MSLSIRQLDPQAAHEVVPLCEQEWGAHYANQYRRYLDSMLPADRAFVFGVWLDAQLIGTGMVAESEVAFELWGISWVVIAPEQRGRGYGSQLIAALEQHASNYSANYDSTHVLVQLVTQSPSFYYRLGYNKIAGWGKEHLMLKDLTPLSLV